ncbi:MAG: PAN domain-containing protein, partial [Trueperaceae bacterium]|nr:PAN domain-containing protein [Trueperaceae bacterium]
RPSRLPRLLGALSVALMVLLAPATALAQDAPVPERFATLQSDVDLPGGDLQSIFDVTLERCMAACLRDGACTAFTFNGRNGSCFLKGAPGAPVPFVDAVSGQVTDRDAAALEMARTAAADLAFLDAWDLDEARDQAEALAERYPADGRTEAEWLDLARRQAAADAVAATGAAATVADGGRAWLAHARALADLAAVERNRTWALHREAVLAAVNAALRLPEPTRADALVVLARALEATNRGEAALAALRLADRIAPGIAGDDLARLREAFGFRVLYQDVDARTGTPRICASFSEDLAPTRDYAPFVQRTAPGLAVEVEGSQLCVTGVAYGERYALTLRAGLPSASGDTLVRDVPIDQYVRDRAPAVRFPGQAYVLPARGPRALPVETVNANELELRLLRVTDRNLVAAIREGSFLRSLGPWEGARFEDLLTELVWEGEASLAGDLNRTTTSRLPLDEVGPLDPGIYVLRANVAGADPYEAPPAMQWFLVSDLGVTALSGNDAVHVVVQRLSDGRPAEGLRVALVARSNRVLGEATTDAQGLATFAAALARGTGNAAPALVLVEDD